MHDLILLSRMRALGVKWKHGRLPRYPATMTGTEKRKADSYYDAMSDAFVENMVNRTLPRRA